MKPTVIWGKLAWARMSGTMIRKRLIARVVPLWIRMVSPSMAAIGGKGERKTETAEEFFSMPSSSLRRSGGRVLETDAQTGGGLWLHSHAKR
jgi:hypothetical protein